MAETIRRKLGEREFSIILDSIFRFPPLYSTEIHKIISEIPFSAIITTNYDKLIETAYSITHSYIPPVYTVDNAPDVIASLSNDWLLL